MSRADSRDVYDMMIAELLEEKKREGMHGGFFGDLFDSVFDLVEGLANAVAGALEYTIKAIAHIGETIALIVRAVVGDVGWDAVLDELGEVFQDIGAVLVYLNPVRLSYEWLSEAPLTAHAFHELDKFTGGMLTTAANLSDLPWRAMRGDPISKAELLQDALLIITIVAIVFTGPVGLGVLVGSMVGREVCSKQTEARDACQVAFQIAGAAAGSWGSAVTGVTWGTAAETAQAFSAGELSAAEEAAWLAGDEAYQTFLLQQAEHQALMSTTSFLPHLVAAGENYLLNAGINTATQHAAELCQAAHLMGSEECRILSQVAANYIKSDSNQPWEEFMAQEVARIGAEQLMLSWFPQHSPEHQAIQAQWQIKYVDVPYDQTVIVQQQQDKRPLLLLAGGVALMLMGAAT